MDLRRKNGSGRDDAGRAGGRPILPQTLITGCPILVGSLRQGGDFDLWGRDQIKISGIATPGYDGPSPFALKDLHVMTQSSIPFHDDDVFLQEHFSTAVQL